MSGPVPSPGFVLFEAPRDAAAFWELVRRADEYVVAGGWPDAGLKAAWAEFFTQAAAHVMRRTYPVVPRETP